MDSILAYNPVSDVPYFIEHLADQERLRKYTLYRRYYDGDQNLNYATRKFTNAFGNMFTTFAYNRCAGVIDAIADRLQLIGFTVEGDTPDLSQEDAVGQEIVDPIEAETDRIWRYNRMDQKQGELTTEALKTGDGYIIIWPEVNEVGETTPIYYVNEAGSCCVNVDSETGYTVSAAKLWRVAYGPNRKLWRLNLYYPDAIYKLVSKRKSDSAPAKFSDYNQYSPTMDGLKDEPWPLPNPFNQVPVFHFANNAPSGRYGRSELRDIIPLQDAINKSCMDLMVAMEYGAYPQRYATGLNLGMPDPVTGVVASPFKAGPGETWTGPMGATFGNFDTTDLRQFLEVTAQYDSKISNVARIPAYLLTLSMDNPPSGEALKTADSPFVAKLEDRQISFGNKWEDAHKFALKTVQIEVDTLASQWKPAELRSESEVASVSILKAQYGVPDEQLWEESGYSPTQIAAFKAAKQQAVLDMQRAASAGQLIPFNTGGASQVDSGSNNAGNETA